MAANLLSTSIRGGVIGIGLLLLNGCVNSSVILTPVDQSVKAIRRSSSCNPIFFGLGGGTASLDQALAEPAMLLDDYTQPRVPIKKVRSVAYQSMYYLVAGGNCVEVIGE